ncbi:TPA: recombinase family protein [Vibrio parahaemolyticus]|nr:recombinase family protein [Vibrio parahaemolyticus]
MKASMVRVSDCTTYGECIEMIEAIESNPDNTVGGIKAFTSGYETKLNKTAQNKIEALQRKADKLAPVDEEEDVVSDTPTSDTPARTEQQVEIAMARRTFAYCRVSTTEQTTANQVLALRNAGYDVQSNRVIEDVVSGSVCAMERQGFKSLVEHKLEAGDTLVVLKLDRLGRDAMDVQKTIELLLERGVKVVSLDLPVSDLTSPEGKLMMQLMGAFAEFERNRIRERTVEGQNRARAEGKTIGRPEATKTKLAVQECKAEGLSQSKTAERLGVSVSTVKYHWNVDGEVAKVDTKGADDEYHRIIEAITGSEGLSVRGAAKALGVSTGKVQRAKAKHIKQLKDAGVDVKSQYPNQF